MPVQESCKSRIREMKGVLLPRASRGAVRCAARPVRQGPVLFLNCVAPHTQVWQ
jgi:hypothetical protein